MPRRCAARFGAVALVSVAVSLGAQQNPTPTFRAATNLVRVDAVVVDADGNPVHGLTAADFTLSDRGTPQSIAAFDEIRHKPPTSVPRGHMDVADNLVDDASQLMVLVLDDFHIRKEWTAKARDVAKDFVRSLSDDTLMALLSTTGKFNVELTSDRQRILDMLDRFAGGEYPLAYFSPGGIAPFTQSSPGLTAEEAARLHVNFAPVRQPADMDWSPIMAMGGGGKLVGVPKDSLTLYKLLENAAGVLAREDNRHKAFAWVSTGLAFGTDGLPQAIAAMRRAGIATYAIDPTGTEHVIPGGAYSRPGTDDLPTPWDMSAAQRHTSLVRTSRDSGGIAIVGQDDLAAGVRRIVQDFDDYYVLGFYPGDATTPGARPLQVTMTRPGLSVRARMSYEIAAPPVPSKDPLRDLVTRLTPKSDLPLRLYAAALPVASSTVPAARVVIALEVTAQTARLASVNGSLTDRLKYGIYAVDLRKGRVGTSVTGEANLTLSPTQTLQPDRVTYTVAAALTLPPGRYQLRASAASEQAGTNGSVFLSIDIPDFRQAALALSDVVLGASRVPVATDNSFRLLQKQQPLPFAPTLDRAFDPSGSLRMYAEVSTRKPAASIETAVLLIGTGDREAWSAHRTLTPADGGQLSVDIPLAALAAGGYVLRVTASDGANHVQRDIGVTIR